MTEYSEKAKEELWDAFDKAMGPTVEERRTGDRTTEELKARYGLSDEAIRYRMKRANFQRLKVYDKDSGAIILVWRAPQTSSSLSDFKNG